MSNKLVVAAATLLLLLAFSGRAVAQHRHGVTSGALQVPESMRIEHEEIHGQLEAATRAPGSVGAAARELAELLEPHFRRENEIALPPLALLAPLARGEASPEMARVLPLTDSLRAELPQMLEEHVRIGAAARRLEQAARDAGNAGIAALAHKLQLHARAEEEINYPAAILVGDLVRAHHRAHR